VKPGWSWYLAVGLAAAGWVSLMSWLGRDLNCYIDNCASQAVMWWLGLSAILLVAATAITRKMGRISLRSLGALAASFTIPGVLAWASWSYGLNPEDRFEAVFGALSFPMIGVPVVFGFVLVVSLVVHTFWPGQSNPSSPRSGDPNQKIARD
jgi:hypothetical protein